MKNYDTTWRVYLDLVIMGKREEGFLYQRIVLQTTVPETTTSMTYDSGSFNNQRRQKLLSVSHSLGKSYSSAIGKNTESRTNLKIKNEDWMIIILYLEWKFFKRIKVLEHELLF